MDFSDFDATIAGAAGGLVSTPADLDRFYGALLGGRLLPSAQLAEMQYLKGTQHARTPTQLALLMSQRPQSMRARLAYCWCSASIDGPR